MSTKTQTPFIEYFFILGSGFVLIYWVSFGLVFGYDILAMLDLMFN